MKIVFWALIGLAVVLWLIRPKKQSSVKDGTQYKGAGDPPPEQEGSAEAMVQCAQCGLHLPRSEAFASQSGMLFCSEEHFLQHSSR